MIIIEFIYWLSMLTVFWPYAGYYLTLWIIAQFHSKSVYKREEEINVSLIITVYNEEKRIREKLENALSLEYPREKLEIIVVSDCSTDKTHEIVESFAVQGIKLMIMPERRGKHFGQGRGIAAARSEVVVLSDATTFLSPDSIRKITRSFADPLIGCVSGQDQIQSAAGESQGEGAYVRYEMKLRELESRVGSLVGVSGSFFATRKHLCKDWLDNMSADFYMPIITVMNGMRSISEPEAMGTYRVLRDSKKEFNRKVRTVVHGLEVLFHFKQCLNPLRHGTFSLQMISHKLCRWLVPFAMIALIIANALLINVSWFYTLTFILQLIMYGIIGATLLFERLQENKLFRLVGFFGMVNLSILVAWYKYWTHQEYVIWDATKR